MEKFGSSSPIKTIRIANKIQIVTGSKCSKGQCIDYGCSFPDCVITGDKKYNNIEEIKQDYPNREVHLYEV